MDKALNRITIEGLADLSWADSRIDLDTFKREIGKSEFVIFLADASLWLGLAEPGRSRSHRPGSASPSQR
jgi:hypothetical protein